MASLHLVVKGKGPNGEGAELARSEKHTGIRMAAETGRGGGLGRLKTLRVRAHWMMTEGVCRLHQLPLALIQGGAAKIKVLTARPESGAATAEYAVVLIAATAFAGLLLAILKSDTVRSLLSSLVKQALSV